MSTPFLSQETERRLDVLFRPEDRAEAEQLLAEQCGNNLPFLENLDEQGLERFQFAALKLSGGDLSRLRSAIGLAKTDWRDLLMAAGFGGDPRAHVDWMPGSQERARQGAAGNNFPRIYETTSETSRAMPVSGDCR